MHTDRRAILHLVAMGRITATEAERLLIAWNDGREVLWILAACILVASITQLHLEGLLPVLLQIAHALPPVMTHFFGGMQ
jgi:hypothetical protein